MNDSWKVRILVRETICSCCSVAMTETLNESWFQRCGRWEVEGSLSLSDFRGVETSCSSSFIAYGGKQMRQHMWCWWLCTVHYCEGTGRCFNRLQNLHLRVQFLKSIDNNLWHSSFHGGLHQGRPYLGGPCHSSGCQDAGRGKWGWGGEWRLWSRAPWPLL